MGRTVDLRAQVDDLHIPQPKLVNYATMLEMGSSLLSVVLAYQTVLFLPWKTISPYL